MIDLVDWRSEKTFATRLLHLVRTNRRALADELLRAQIERLPTEFAVPDTDEVELSGWDELLEGFVEADDQLAAKGERLAAVALDLVNRRGFGSKDGRFPQHDEIRLEARYYEDPPDQAARDCPRRLLRPPGSRTRYALRSRAQRATRLTLRGTGALADFQRRLGPPVIGSNLDSEKAAFLAGWLLWLRTETIVAQAVTRRGLPRAMPVIFGVDTLDRPMESNSWDYGPVAETLHLAPAEPLTDELRDQLRAARRTKQAEEGKASRSADEAFRGELRSDPKLKRRYDRLLARLRPKG